MSEITFDHQYYPYPSQRNVTIARNGAVATSQPLAAQAGLSILRKGGNAIDAAIATAACLTVVEPTSNGIGSDAFALVWTAGRLHGLNASGPAPQEISIAKLKELGYTEMPKFGMIPVTVPGAPAAWAALSERFGRLPLTEVLAPAIGYAKNGFPLSPTLGRYWQAAAKANRAELQEEMFSHWYDTFAPGGRAPGIGEMWSSPGHASTLQSIADTKAESFYRGHLADLIDAFSRKHGGFLCKEDLAAYHAEWVEPISINYRGIDVWEIPPNGQGMIALMALNILKGFEFNEKDSVDTYHRQIEALKLAFADGLKYITDIKEMQPGVRELLSEEYAAVRRALISEQAIMPLPGDPPQGGTVYLATADGEGNMVSYIQSNYMGFGSRIVIPGTGISLQNRGQTFSLDENHANALRGGKKTYHTIIPGFMTCGKDAIGPFGVMGGFMQPQGHLQVVMNMVDFHLNPQAALDAPRWQWVKEKVVQVEPHFPDHIAQALARRGHSIQRTLDGGGFGRGQIIYRDPKTGVLMAGTEPRTDAQIACY
jgi:gamma-glutamyltranspeptidase/glutathione hydrolase